MQAMMPWEMRDNVKCKLPLEARDLGAKNTQCIVQLNTGNLTPS